MLRMSVVCWLFWWKLDVSRWNIKKVRTILIKTGLATRCSWYMTQISQNSDTWSVIFTSHLGTFWWSWSFCWKIDLSKYNTREIWGQFQKNSCSMSILMHIFWCPIFHCCLRALGVKNLFIWSFSTTMMRKKHKRINCWKIVWWSQIKVNVDFLICQKSLWVTQQN